ncbi:Subtilisin-like protease [Hordeum vulgare]|nr:Subtilisin-like protease [Hordeum vulgare]
MAMAPVALALCLCATVLLSTPPPAHSYTDHSSSPPSPVAAETTSSSSEYKTYIILLKPRADAHVMDDEARQGWYRSFLPDDVTAHGEPRLVRSYKTIFHGFAALLTEEELDAASRKPGFGRWFPDEMMYPTTTRTPEFLGLTKDAGMWAQSSYGKGIIIGVIDSGIDSRHPSFGDAGVSPPPARWKGACTGTDRGVRCNNKLIGVRSFVDYNPADETGHGTHVASIAAGNFVANASSSHGQAAGTAAGIAPGAHLAAYKACRPSGCLRSNVVDAMDTAVRDGVDIISISLGRKAGVPLNKDVVAIGAFRAVAKGVVVVTSAGNDGPDPSTVKNDMPWEITVGAGSVDRRLAADLVLESGDMVEGEALVQGVNSTAFQPIHYPGEGNLCKNVSAERTRGHIVICDDARVNVAAQARIIKNLYDNGAAHVVLIGREKSGFSLSFREYGSSVVQEPAAVGHKLKDYSRYPDAAAQAFFKGTRVGVGQSPTVAHFSSRGPSRTNPHILKPDILAPGLNILAAATASPDRGPFRFKSGTSMAAPHISGVVALLKSVHPEWSQAAIRSAIMTTADDLDDDGNRIMDEKHQPASAFAAGAGQVNATRAVDPGLVYDMEVRDYAGYVCHLFATLDDDDDYAVQDIIQDLSLNCKTVAHLSDFELNYPSIVVPANTTVRRTLTNVGPAGEYTGRLSMTHDVGVDFSPKSLSFSRPGEKLTFEVSQHGLEVAEGFLIWESDTHTVQSPLVVVH